MLIIVRLTPARKTLGSKLIAHLERECQSRDFGTLESIMGTGDPNRDFRDCLSQLMDKGSRICLLEDDAWPCFDFMRRLSDLPTWPDVIQLWSNRKVDMELLRREEGVYARQPSLLSGTVGLVLAPSAIRAWSECWSNWSHARHPTAWDLCLRDAVRKHKLPLAVAIPSLVQHLPVPSLLGTRSCRRQSRTFTAHYGPTPFERGTG